MARIRCIKPDFFLHEELAELSPLHRLLFIGLWTLADKEGRLEDRPKRIKAALLPWDKSEVETLLADLDRGGFILRYAVDGVPCIAIPGFRKHQRPHPKEVDSTLPPPPEGILRTTRNGPFFSTASREISRPSLDASRRVPPGREGKESQEGVSESGKGTAPAPDTSRPAPGDIPLVERLLAAWEKARGYALDVQMKRDGDALRDALAKKGSSPAEVERRWGNALGYVRFPVCGGLPDLVRHWDRYGAPESVTATPGQKPAAKGLSPDDYREGEVKI